MYVTQFVVSSGGGYSLRLHIKGWESLHYNKVFVYGLGTETLAGYFTQQARWAMGTPGVFKKIVPTSFRNPYFQWLPRYAHL